jgi:hypothetical protein
VTGRSGSGAGPRGLGRRTNLVATAAMVVVAVGLLTVVLLIEGVRSEPATWAVLGLVGLIVVTGLFLAVRAITADDRAALPPTSRPILEPRSDVGPVAGEHAADAGPDLDLTLADAVDPLAPVPADQAVLDAGESSLDLTRGPAVRVVLHPGPITRRRLAGRPDALVVTADADGLDVPAWIVEGRSRLIERADRVLIPWASIERFRVRATSDGPDVYDITARPDAPAPRRWRVRRDEITDELTLLDHVRRVGRVTIELEDSIRS